MKTKEIINGSSRIEDESADDKETSTKAAVIIGGEIISAMDYDKNNVTMVRCSKGANVDDIVYHRNNKNNKYNADIGKLNLEDNRYFGRISSIADNDGYLISDQHYCNCGGGGGGNNKKKPWSMRSSTKGSSTTNFYEIDKLMYNEIFEMENGIAVAAAAAAATSAVYTTKKSLMLNEFLELNDHHRSVQHYYVNDVATSFANRFATSTSTSTSFNTATGKCRSSTKGGNGAGAANVNLDVLAEQSSIETSVLANTVEGSANGVSLSLSSSSTTVGATGKGCRVSHSQSQSLCLTSSVLLSDKRLVGLFRSVALYWFFCLNTVLAKGDYVFKRKASTVAVSPLHAEINQLSLHKSFLSADNLQLKICCPDVVLAVGAVGDNFLWDLSAADEAEGEGALLSWAEHSKSKMFNDLFEKVLRDLADNCGIFTTAAAGGRAFNAGETTPFKNQFEKMVESRKPVEPKGVACDSEERRTRQPIPTKKSTRSGVSGKNMVGVRRKCVVDVLDYYYYDEEGGDEEYEESTSSDRTSRATPTVVNRVIWKKRAIKNKQKSKRKLGTQQQPRVQQMIIERYNGANSSYVINDGYEEVVAACEQAPPKAAAAAVTEDEEIFLDFDRYAENLKREVALRQLRKRKQLIASNRLVPPSSSSKIAPPRMSLRGAESSTEDELSGTGSTSSSLLLELEEPSSYFLPDGRFHSGTQKYPKYNMWRSPLVVETVLPAGDTPVAPAQPSASAKQSIFRHSKTASAKAAPPPAASFKPYRLWEPWWKVEDDFMPSFVAARRHNLSPKFASMATATGVNANVGPPSQPTKAATAARSTFGKQLELAPQSMYTLWGSPKIIDFLPGGSGSSASSSSVRLNAAGSYSSGDASTSPEEFSSLEYDYSSAESFEVPNAAADLNHQHQFNVRAGKFLNFKPIINGFVSFTDRGAFKYYKKPTAIARPTVLSVAVLDDKQPIEHSEKASEAAVDDVPVDDDSPYHFKPIQPAFKVRTDTPPTFERSDCGTLWCNNKKLMTFKHELDDVSQADQPRRNSASDLDSFQPKFVVNSNDVGCQTDWFELNGFDSAAFAAHASSSSFFGPNFEKKNSQDPSYVSGAMLFYAWDEVFNFFNKPSLGNIDVKAHLDFSCFF